jgi:anti-anti-sigma factor
MEITFTKTEKPASVTILHLVGKLDSTNFQDLVDEAQRLHAAGISDLILDLGQLTFIGSAGLGALHQVALLFQGKKHAGKNDSWSAYRWSAFRSLDSNHTRKTHQHVKLLSPSEDVLKVLDMIGFTSLFEIFTDLQQAVASFHQPSSMVSAAVR